jgi:hypothetical protein
MNCAPHSGLGQAIRGASSTTMHFSGWFMRTGLTSGFGILAEHFGQVIVSISYPLLRHWPFSKKVENLICAIALHFVYYNFVQIHQTLRVTPAMEAGLADSPMEIRGIALLTQQNSERATSLSWLRALGYNESCRNQPQKENQHMARVPAYHSVLETDRKVYHDSSLCTEGNHIERKNRRAGTGARPRCQRCKDGESAR